jgi:hypothetical protein
MQREMRARHGAMRGQMQQVPTQEMREHLPRQHHQQRPLRVRGEVCDGGGALQGKVSRVAASTLWVAVPSKRYTSMRWFYLSQISNVVFLFFFAGLDLANDYYYDSAHSQRILSSTSTQARSLRIRIHSA